MTSMTGRNCVFSCVFAVLKVKVHYFNPFSAHKKESFHHTPKINLVSLANSLVKGN